MNLPASSDSHHALNSVRNWFQAASEGLPGVLMASTRPPLHFAFGEETHYSAELRMTLGLDEQLT